MKISRSADFRPRHRIGALVAAASLAALSLPAVSHAWSEDPVTAEVSTVYSYGVAVTADNNGNTFQTVVYKGSISFGSHTVNAAS